MQWGISRGVLRGDFGISFTQERPVKTILLDGIGNSIALLASAALVGLLIAIPLGTYVGSRGPVLVRFDYPVVFGALLIMVWMQTVALILMEAFGPYVDPRVEELMPSMR